MHSLLYIYIYINIHININFFHRDNLQQEMNNKISHISRKCQLRRKDSGEGGGGGGGAAARRQRTLT